MDPISPPKTFNEAFENSSIASVRAIEKQLRAGVTRDKERLRILVGGNYRELLSTAEEIISLDSQARLTETGISELSQQCRPPQRFQSTREVPPTCISAAKSRLLTQCILAGFTALRQRALLQCAQLTVIARLLLKSLNDDEPIPNVVQQLQARAASLRRQLLRHIDSQLSHPACNLKALVEAVGAYCLVTSASSGDAIKHFRTLRLEKLKQQLSRTEVDKAKVGESLKYVIVSIQSLKSLLSRAVNDLLSNVQRQPILEHSSIRSLDSLGLSQLHSLIPKDILTFTPYIKRVLLSSDEIEAVLQEWSTSAAQIFTQGLTRALKQLNSSSEVLDLRQGLYSTILPVYFSIYGQDILFNSIRAPMNARLLEICKHELFKLIQIGENMVAQSSTPKFPSLPWDETFLQTSFNDRDKTQRLKTLINHVQTHHLGVSGSLHHSLKLVKKWSRASSDLDAQISALRTTRWQDKIEEADEGEEEEQSNQVISVLLKDDPEYISDEIKKARNETIVKFNALLASAVSDLTKSDDEKDIKIESIAFLIRIIRESIAIIGLHPSNSEVSSTDSNPSGPTNLLNPLYQKLSDHVITRTHSKFDIEAEKRKNQPCIPDMPSPLTISFLRTLCTTMLEIGGADIWSPGALTILKSQWRTKIFPDETGHVERYTKTAFDRWYLREALGDTTTIEGKTQPQQQQQEKDEEEKDEEEEGSDVKETKIKAQAYWTRTKLLFGMLG